MKAILPLFLTLSFFAFAGEKYGVYDLQGNNISTFEAEPPELSEKIRQFKNDNPHKKLYVSSIKKGKNSKPTSHYTFKTGSYIEAARNETFSLCPHQKAEGTWISEYSVSLNDSNCISVQTPDLARTFRILFLENSGYTDTIQVLVDQSYIQMGDYSHKIWVVDSNEIKVNEERHRKIIYIVTPGNYENRVYNQPLVVDKTKLIVADTWHYSRIDTNRIIIDPFQLEREYKNVNLEKSRLPLVNCNHAAWWLANERSKMEGLDTAYFRTTLKEARSLRDAGKAMFAEQGYHKYNSDSSLVIVLDIFASGYRVPTDEEWFFLMRAGALTTYYWGDEGDLRKEEDRLKISRYAWMFPSELKPVAQLLPNAFGLYDMVGIAAEACDGGPESFIMCGKWGVVGSNYEGFRLIRKTPKLHKLEKF